MHCHSTASDGADPPAEVGRQAAAGGLRLFCLTDHDTCAGWGEAAAAFGRDGGAALCGVEISAVEEGRTVHLLVYDAARGPGWSALAERLIDQASARRARMRDMLARLSARGVAVAFADVEAEAAGAVMGRPHLARALVKGGHVSSVGEAFDRWLGDGGPADVPLARFEVADALALARAAGARVSLAHPHTIGPVRAADLLRRHREAGLEGLEAWYGAYSPREREDWLALARDHRAVVTAGSDYHGFPDLPGLGVELPEPHAARLLAWLGIA
ncbi:MAG TPA: PHP domain-containing protein [Kofleriaceae bacterium]|nr:PHP domain-containing protein [Kofleriaceae bacterium]